MKIAGLCCHVCGSDELVLAKPGSLPVLERVTGFLLKRGEAASGTCLACWPVLVVEQPTKRQRASRKSCTGGAIPLAAAQPGQ